MLENTMMIFTTLAVWFYFLRLRSGSRLLLALASVSLILALFTKGVFCLYIWGVPFFDWLFRRRSDFHTAVVDTLIIVLATVIPAVLLYYFAEPVRLNVDGYFQEQLIISLESELEHTVSNRFHILISFFKGILPQIVIGVAPILISRSKISVKDLRTGIPSFLFFFFVALGGVLPIIISLKQRSFYIITVYPFFALGVSHYLLPVVNELMGRVNFKSRGFLFFRAFTWLTIFAGVAISFAQVGRIGRNESKVSDAYKIIEYTGRDLSIRVCSSMEEDWSLHGYYARYGHIGLTTNNDTSLVYYIQEGNCMPEIISQHYEFIDLDTKDFFLYRRK